MILSIIGVLITFGVIIFIHELGHFIAARAVGIRVEQFAFGFGKAIVKWQRGPTEYRINWIPLGGYVKPAGEDIQNSSGDPDEYFAKPWYKRLVVVLAGATMNYVLALVLFSALAFHFGDPKASNEPVIGALSPSYPAEMAGLKEGDRILAVNSTTVATWEEMAGLIRQSKDKELILEYEREGVKASANLTPKEDAMQSYPVIGIAPSIGYEKIGMISAVGAGAQQCYYWSALTIKSLFRAVQKREKPDVAGPIGIVQIVGKAVHSGFENFIWLVALLNVAVGLFNLFPIPVLDGGTAILFIYEGISRRKLTEQLIVKANSVGIIILLGIFLFATYSDINRIVTMRKPKPAAGPATDNKQGAPDAKAEEGKTENAEPSQEEKENAQAAAQTQTPAITGEE